MRTRIRNRKRRVDNTRRFERITFNLLGTKARMDQLEGRTHLVVPCVMITEGVHNGNHGPGLYRESETEPTVLDWNGMPVVLGHPAKQSARSAKVLNKTGLGTVLNTEWDHRKRLTCEVWLDVKRTNAVDARIIRAIENKKKLEVSTGLFLNRFRKKGFFRGEKYQWIARNQKPDHLAILPDEIGACSVKKGCGLLANSRKITKNCNCNKQEISMLSTKRKARMIRQLIANSGVWEEADRKDLSVMPDKAFKKIYNSAIEPDEDEGAILIRKKKKVVRNADGKIVRREEPEPIVKKKKKVKVDNSQDWKKLLPPEALAVINQGQKAITRRKEALVEIITNNENNVLSEKFLMNQEADLLEGIAALAQTEEGETDEDGMFVRGFRPDYSGAIGAAPTSNRRGRSSDDDDDLDDDEEGLAPAELFPTNNSDDDDDKSAKKKSKKSRM